MYMCRQTEQVPATGHTITETDIEKKHKEDKTEGSRKH